MKTVNKKLKAILLLMGVVLFTIPTCAITYEDAEDNATIGWVVYTGTEDAIISNVEDVERGSRVIELNGEGLNSGYRLGYPGGWGNPASWNSQETSIKWSMKYSEKYIIYISVQTQNGHRLLAYTNSDTNNGISFGTIHHGLGQSSNNGTWQTFTRDLEADLEEFEPDNQITFVNAFSIRGSGYIDDIMSVDNSPIENNLPTANAGADQVLNITTTDTTVSLDGTASIAGSGAPITQYEWFYNESSLGTGATLDVNSVPPGDYTVMLTVTDSSDNTASDTINIKVTIQTGG